MPAGSIIKVSCRRCGRSIVTRSRVRKWCDECWRLIALDSARVRAASNRDVIREQRRVRYAARVAVLRQRDQERYQREADRRRANAKRYYAEHREQVLARMSTPEGRRYSRERMRERMVDSRERLDSNLSRAIRASLHDKGRRSWEQLVGYSLSELVQHLERQFGPGMTWDNYGKTGQRWHVDHIVPKSSFRYETASDQEFAACWALSNLQPMWARQNIQKSARRELLL